MSTDGEENAAGGGEVEMAMVLSQHEYSLKPGVTPEAFERAVHIARRRGLFRLPGLVDYYFLRGLRGARQDEYAAVWIYASREAWEALWGPVEAPLPPEAYPPAWLEWENELLRPLLDRDPDRITLTAYQVIASAKEE